MISRYPMDFDDLQKGDIITVQELERLTGKKFGTNEFAFKALSLQAQISDATGFTVKIRNGEELHILTDEEASKHNHNEFQRHKKGMFRRNRLMGLVDMNALSETMRAEHERKLIKQGQLLQAMSGAKKQKIEVKREAQSLSE